MKPLFLDPGNLALIGEFKHFAVGQADKPECHAVESGPGRGESHQGIFIDAPSTARRVLRDPLSRVIGDGRRDTRHRCQDPAEGRFAAVVAIGRGRAIRSDLAVSKMVRRVIIENEGRLGDTREGDEVMDLFFP